MTPDEEFAWAMADELLVPQPGWDPAACANDRGGATHPRPPDPGAFASCLRCRSAAATATAPLYFLVGRATATGEPIGWPLHIREARPVLTIDYGAPRFEEPRD